jgi:hypothetical protein
MSGPIRNSCKEKFPIGAILATGNGGLLHAIQPDLARSDNLFNRR